MGDLDPVSWETIVNTVGPPAQTVTAYVEQLQEDVRDEDPYDAVKTIHDALSSDSSVDPSVPGQGEVFIIAYLLEQNGSIASSDGDGDGEFPSLLDRRPSSDRLHKLSWERGQTMWWIAIQVGVHWALVRYWLYEDDIPLKERNFTEESMEQIRAYQEQQST